MIRLLTVFIMALGACMMCHAYETEVWYTDVFNPAFKSLQTKVNHSDQLPPIINLSGDDILSIGFDELSSDRRYMRYELIHCNAQWQRDGLVASEYTEGFNEGIVEEYEHSVATLIPYVHYTINIPNPDISVKLSGNYILRVYDESDLGTTLLQQRFSVCDNAVKARGDVTSRTDKDYNGKHQQLSITVDTEGLPVYDLASSVIIAVEQNSRTDNSVYLNRPSRIAGSTVYWEHVPQLIFDAGNEYRRFETTSTSYPGMGVENVSYSDPLYHMELRMDEPRAGGSYIFDRTQKGRFRIREYNSDHSDTEAEYSMVHFFLYMPELNSKDVFIEGDLTGRQFSPESIMTYNRVRGGYEKSLLLKQGAYNYQYLAVPAGAVKGQTETIEGDFYPTANEYIIKVYLREPSSRYDRLVGVTSVTAGK